MTFKFMKNNSAGEMIGCFRLKSVLVLMVLLSIILGCDKAPDLKSGDFDSDEKVGEFLKEQFFEIPAEPISVGDFEYTLLDGSKEHLSSNLGKLVFLNFWATWCYPCRKEMPDMQILADQLKGESFRILAVNYGDDKGQIEQFIQKYSYSFEIVTDNDKSISSKLSVRGLPTTLIIDKKGRFLGRLVGPANWKKSEFLTFFKLLSRKQP